jgi:hypothetical protein
VTKAQCKVLIFFVLCVAVVVGAKAVSLLDALQAETHAREQMWLLLPDRLDTAIQREGNATRATLAKSVDQLGARAERQLSAARVDVREIAGDLAGTLDNRSASIEDAAVAEIRQTRAEIVQRIDPPIQALTAAVNEYGRVPREVGERLEPWTNCHGNGACWQAQATAMLGAGRVTLGETSRTMKVVREATPQILNDIEITTGNVAVFTRPTKWYWRLLPILPFAASAVR